MTSHEQITDVLSVGATFTAIEQAVEVLVDVEWADEEIAVILGFPLETRAAITLRLTEVAANLRHALRELDGRLLQLAMRDTVEA